MLISCVTVGKLLNFSVPPFSSHGRWGYSTDLIGMFGGLNEYSYTQLLDPRWIHHKCSVRTCYYFLGLETLSVVFRVFCWPSPVFGKLVPPSRASGGVLPLRYPWWPCSGPQEGPPGGLQALAFACLFPCPFQVSLRPFHRRVSQSLNRFSATAFA